MVYINDIYCSKFSILCNAIMCLFTLLTRVDKNLQLSNKHFHGLLKPQSYLMCELNDDFRTYDLLQLWQWYDLVARKIRALLENQQNNFVYSYRLLYSIDCYESIYPQIPMYLSSTTFINQQQYFHRKIIISC